MFSPLISWKGIETKVPSFLLNTLFFNNIISIKYYWQTQLCSIREFSISVYQRWSPRFKYLIERVGEETIISIIGTKHTLNKIMEALIDWDLSLSCMSSDFRYCDIVNCWLLQTLMTFTGYCIPGKVNYSRKRTWLYLLYWSCIDTEFNMSDDDINKNSATKKIIKIHFVLYFQNGFASTIGLIKQESRPRGPRNNQANKHSWLDSRPLKTSLAFVETDCVCWFICSDALTEMSDSQINNLVNKKYCPFCKYCKYMYVG